MPDDCGELMDEFFDSFSTKDYKDTFSERAEAFLIALPQFIGDYKPYTRVCTYCRTDTKKDTCVNCGAPQVAETRSYKTYDEFGMVSFESTK